MNTFIKKAIAIGAVSLLSSTAFADLNCKLGDTCNIPSSHDKVAFNFDDGAGTNFKCGLRANSKKDLTVTVFAGANYQVPPQTITASSDGKAVYVILHGSFNEFGKDGQILVQQSDASHDAEGSIKCDRD